jgi:hypothetical protein
MKIRFKLSTLVIGSFLFACDNSLTTGQPVSFYEVPLVCGAAPEIGCGSRIKPLFLDLQNNSSVSEAWANREGTVIAIKWKDNGKRNNLSNIEGLFEKHSIEPKLISDANQTDSLKRSLTAGGKSWFKGMEVDSLSLYEAGVIAHTLTDFALEASLVNKEEASKIRTDIESYFKKELVKVRSAKELNSEECQDEWRKNGFKIYEKHIGLQRANAVSRFFDENELTIMKQESCCSEGEDACCKKKDHAMTDKSTITCPYCGHQKVETMPTDVCQIRYTCEKCKKDIHPKNGDCCVYCSYGDHKCPSKQDKPL